jgi:hypothetical protein
VPISVGNGQQIAPRLPSARRRGNAKSQKQSVPESLAPSNTPLRQIEQETARGRRRVRRLEQNLPAARAERQAARTPAGRRGAVVQRREAEAELVAPVESFTEKVREAGRQEREARAAVPNHPRLAIFPVLPSYTEQQKDAILKTQGPRLQELVRSTGRSGADLVRGLSPQDAEQVGLFARLVQERQQRTATSIRRTRRGEARRLRAQGVPEDEIRQLLAPARARPADPGEVDDPNGGMFGLAAVLPETLRGDRLDNSLRQLGAVGTSAGTLAAFPGNVALGLGEAVVRDPIGVTGKTAKGAAELAVGSVAAIPETVVRLAQDPVGGSRELAGSALADYLRRYEPLLEGDRGEFADRIVREGAAPELFDALTAASLGGAAAGRVGTSMARAGALGRRARALVSEPRPGLRVSGNVVRPQELSPNMLRAVAQRAEDRGRRRAQERRAGREGGQRGLPTLGPDEVVARTRAGQNRLQRIEASKVQSRAFQRMSDLQKEEVSGAQREIARLSPKQRAVTFQVLQGLVTPDDPVAAVRQLRSQRAKVVAAREAAGVRDLPRVLRRTNDELAAIDLAIKHADEIFTPKLAEFQRREAGRSQRLEQDDPGVKPLTAEVARARPQGERYGVEHTYSKAEDALERAIRKGKVADPDAARQALIERKPELERQYLSEIRALRERESLPEPAFVSHQKRPIPGRADRAIGSGNRAVVGPRKREYGLLREGRADQSPDAYTQSIARTTKRGVQWQLVDDQFRAHSMQLRADRVRAALRRRNVNVDHLSIEDLRRVAEHEGWDLRDFEFYNPGRLRRESLAGADTGDVELGGEPAQGAAASLAAATMDARRLAAMPEVERAVFVRTRGWRLVPKGAAGEIQSAANVSGAPGRAISKVQGIQSRVLLGMNPTWLMMQGASNLMLTGFGTRGRLTDLAKAQVWFRRLPEAQRREIDLMLGQGVFEGRVPHIGAASDNALINGWRAFKATSFVRRAGALNPLDAVFRIDDAQNKAFKRTVLYSHVKRKAYADMGRNVGRLMQAQERVAGVMKLGPRERMAAILEDPAALEQQAQAALDVLGDYSRFTSRERRYLKRGILFYGFMRYAVRTAFYTLPVRHPIALGLTAELANLHNQEVRELLGGDEAPWAYGRIFFEKDGRLSSVDLGRINPVTSPITDVVMEGPRALGGLASPIVQAIANQAYGTSLFSGKPFTGRGSAQYGSGLGGESRARILVDQLGSTAFPYRVAETVATGGAKTSDDSLPWDPRPIEYRDGEARARELTRQEALGSTGDQVKRQLVPFIPRPDSTRETVRGIQEREGTLRGGDPSAEMDPELERRLRLLRARQPSAPDPEELERRLRLLRGRAPSAP